MTNSPRRLVLVGSALLIVGLLAGCASAAPRPGPSASAPAPVATALRIAGRIGAAQQMMAKDAPAGVAANPTDVQRAALADQGLAIDLLQRVQSSQGGENVCVSPMSLALALTMLQNGARGKTLAGIEAAMHTGALDGTALDAGWAALVDDWKSAAASSGFSLQSANSLWLSPSLPMRAGFMSALASYFNTGVWRVDFADPSASDAINKWTSQQTHGRITKLFDRLDPATRAVLANAVYFKAAWAQPFDAHDTQPGPFTSTDGTQSTASFMSQTATMQLATTNDYQAVQLPYKGDRFAALAIMPTRGSLDQFVRGLDAKSLGDVTAALHSDTVQLRMPKFTTTSTLDLNAALEAMGMSDAFSGSADFSALSSVPLQVSQVVQRVYLKVAEKGTEAAAVTGIGMTDSAARASGSILTLDHPFLFLIRDTQTGAILFAAEVQDPTT
jgi:serpin B